MTLEAVVRYAALVTVAVAIGMGVHLVRESKATSYLSSDAKACINCHVMESYYATWQHSSHAQRATCVECHLPVDDYIDKYASKTRDGWNHSVAFTLNTYGKRMLITDDGARRVQENCIRCHSSLSKTIIKNVDRYHAFDTEALGGRQCWDCHRQIPHGRVRSINGTPYNLGVKWAHKSSTGGE
ncbi:MAG: cytochrome c nitrite reductase small subunit [Desulfobacterales bacterium]|nr:cytochrome c nitrite reductase small subunit [Desulfobacterales bacterium]